MQAVIFIGLQGTGKSSFFLARFWRTHVRLNLDMLKTRHREALLLQACLHGQQAFVADNTSPSISERARYITPARAAHFQITGYYFPLTVAEALVRNALRADSERVPDKAIFGTNKRLQLPTYEEGFDELYRVTLNTEMKFAVEEWTDE